MAIKKTSRANKGAKAKRPAKKKSTAKRSRNNSAVSAEPRHVPTRGLYGWITHTDIASTDPTATKQWCAKVFGWTFKPPFPMPDGEYHLFAYSEQGGGGISSTSASESPGSLAYVHVENAQAAFDAALREGAEVISPPVRVMDGVTIAVVRAPGGVPIGLSGP